MAGVILSAGNSKRMGFPKALLEWSGKTFIDLLIEKFKACGVEELRIVLGKTHERLIRKKAELKDVDIVINPDPQSEMIDSLKAALTDMPENAEAVMMSPVDNPTVPVNIMKKLIDAFLKHRPLILKPRFKDRGGHPVIFHHSLIPEFLALNDGETARTVFRRHKNETEELLVNSDTILNDFDTAIGYEIGRRKYERGMKPAVENQSSNLWFRRLV